MRLGEIVIYSYADYEQHHNGANECPAVVVRVWSEECVNLRLLHDGPPDPTEWRTSVVRDISASPQPGTWRPQGF